MYCKQCGKEMTDGERYCPNCGTSQHHTDRPTVPSLTSGFANPSYFFKSKGAKIFGIISSIVFGLSMIGGGIYGLFVLTAYTDWVVLGSIFTILGGIGCLGMCGYLISRLVSQK